MSCNKGSKQIQVWGVPPPTPLSTPSLLLSVLRGMDILSVSDRKRGALAKQNRKGHKTGRLQLTSRQKQTDFPSKEKQFIDTETKIKQVPDACFFFFVCDCGEQLLL